MLVTEVDASDADALLDAWLDADPSPPGVSRRELGEPGPQRGSKRATGEDRGQLSAVG